MDALQALVDLRTQEHEEARHQWIEAEQTCRGLEERLAQHTTVVQAHTAALEAYLERLDQARGTRFSIRDIRRRLTDRDSLEHDLNQAIATQRTLQDALGHARRKADTFNMAHNQARAALEAAQHELETTTARKKKRRQRSQEADLDDMLAHRRRQRNETAKP
ncbi:MAG: hypothetical protein AAFX99_02220 [Myxococcota bacterium]